MQASRLVKAGITTLATVLLVAACGGGRSSNVPVIPATTTPVPTSTTSAVPVATKMGSPSALIGDLRIPWGMAFLPNGDALVTERSGALNVLAAADRSKRTVYDVDGVVANGEGGLLGIAVSPTYAQDALLYAYMTTATDNRIVKFTLPSGTSAIGNVQAVLTGIDKAGNHNGGRIAFGPDGMLYAGTGDAGNRNASQDPNDLNGKILRMTPDGSPAAGNPSAQSVIYSMGHRNVQGLAWDRAGRLWASEFGQDTTDEINLIQPGRNYGWPTVEGKGDTRNGTFTNPLVTWRTSEASPSGVAIVDEGGSQSLYVGALRGQRLWRVPLDGAGGVGSPEAIAQGQFGRLRTPVVAPDGSLWVTTSNADSYSSSPGSDKIVRFTAGF